MDGDVLGVGVVGDEVVVAPDDLTVPSHVGEHGIVRLDPGECGLDRLQDGLLEVASSSARLTDVLGGELALVRTQQLAISRTSLATAGSLGIGGG